MTWDSIINVDEITKMALEAFEENKKKVDSGELEITMLIETDRLKQVLSSEYTTNIQVGFFNRLSHDDTKVLEFYPNDYDYMEIVELGPSKFIPGGWDYIFRPRREGEPSVAFPHIRKEQ